MSEVQKLEWRDIDTMWGPETYEATSSVGFYCVSTDEDSAAGSVLVEWAESPDHFGLTLATSIDRCADFELAKAAAERDFNRRLLETPRTAANDEVRA